MVILVLEHERWSSTFPDLVTIGELIPPKGLPVRGRLDLCTLSLRDPKSTDARVNHIKIFAKLNAFISTLSFAPMTNHMGVSPRYPWSRAGGTVLRVPWVEAPHFSAETTDKNKLAEQTYLFEAGTEWIPPFPTRDQISSDEQVNSVHPA